MHILGVPTDVLGFDKFTITVVTIFHETLKLYTYKKPSLELGKLYKFEVRKKTKPSYSFYILESYKLLGELNWLNDTRNLAIKRTLEAEGIGPLYNDTLQSTIKETIFKDVRGKKRITKCNTYVWDNFEDFEKDVYNITGSHYGQFYKTFKPNKYPDNNDLEYEKYFEQDYPFRTKFGHIPHNLKESENSIEFFGENRVKQEDANNFVYVDSNFAKVAFRERHISDFFLYFLIMAYAKKTHRYPTINKKVLIEFLKTFTLKKEKVIEKALKNLEHIGMIKVNAGTINVLSQREYVRKQEARYNAIARNQNRPKEIKFYDEKLKKTVLFKPPVIDSAMPSKPSYIEQVDIHANPFRPYFDLSFAKTTRINSGFVSLILGSKRDMRIFMYELILSSFEEYPICRTRIGYNLFLTPNTQRNYERNNRFLEKRHNYIQFPKHFMDTLTDRAKEKINRMITKGGKFKQTDKFVYRQEGNSYRSERIKWVKSGKTSRLKLSHDILQKYKQFKVVFSGESKSPHFKVFRQSTPYVFSKIQLGKKFFAIKRGSVAVAANPEGFESFEPFFTYGKNGDFFIDSGTFLKTPSYFLDYTAPS